MILAMTNPTAEISLAAANGPWLGEKKEKRGVETQHTTWDTGGEFFLFESSVTY